MSGAGVVRLDGERGSIVAKRAGAREVAAYASGALARAGVRVPRLHAREDAADGTWVLLEHVPLPLPRERRGADPEVVEVLARLHAMPPERVGDPFLPRWDDPLHEAAVARLGAWADEPLTDVRRHAAPVLAPVGVVSGDPNPLNWGLTATGELVLMDWERLGLGHPALDLAIALPGLPGPSDADAVTRAYALAGGREVDPLDVLVAKAWTVAEFAAESDEAGERARVLEGLLPVLHDWLSGVTHLVTPSRCEAPER
jgi:aminoglycoside phosphotransferase (APT) family kinase protein